MNKIVFIMSYPWYSLYQRPNHIARQFKKYGYAVDVIEMRHVVRLNSLLNRMNFEEHRRDIDVLRSVVKLPFISLETAQLVRRIKQIVADAPADQEIIFWFQGFDDSIDYRRILPLIPGMKILDVSDSFPDFFTDAGQRQRLQKAERTVTPAVDVVLTTAEVLFEKFRAYNPRTFLIKNGVDLSRYRNIGSPSSPALTKKLEDLGSRKIICYQGGISAWFDFNLVHHVIENNPDFAFLFVGMVEVRVRRTFHRLRSYDNFHYIGAVGPDILPWVLSKISVGIMPFEIKDLIRATNPIKLYEYLAAGKPVVATRMVEVMRYESKGIVATAEDYDEFSGYVREMAASSDDPAKREERLRIAEENSWDARFRKILEYVPELGAAK